MKAPYCPWCSEPVRSDAIVNHGVPYHARCFEARRVLLGPDLERIEIKEFGE